MNGICCCDSCICASCEMNACTFKNTCYILCNKFMWNVCFESCVRSSCFGTYPPQSERRDMMLSDSDRKALAEVVTTSASTAETEGLR